MTSTAFERCRNIEHNSRRIIEPLPLRDANNRLIYTEQSPIYKVLQRTVGDVVVVTDTGVAAVEMKAEQNNKYGNLFLETWSNKREQRPGWMHYSEADVLLYHFLEQDELFVLDMHALQRWFFNGECRGDLCASRKPASQRFPEKPQSKYAQANDTWGIPVPITVINNEVGLGMCNPLGILNRVFIKDGNWRREYASLTDNAL